MANQFIMARYFCINTLIEYHFSYGITIAFIKTYICKLTDIFHHLIDDLRNRRVQLNEKKLFRER